MNGVFIPDCGLAVRFIIRMKDPTRPWIIILNSGYRQLIMTLNVLIMFDMF